MSSLIITLKISFHNIAKHPMQKKKKNNIKKNMLDF